MEFIGTFFFIFAIAMTGNPFAIAAMLMAWVYIGGAVSGAHYNPAVTLAVALRGHLAWSNVPKYMVAQILGGLSAFALSYFFTGSVQYTQPGQGVTFLQAFIMEVLLAFVLALVVLVVATWDKFRPNYVFGFAIGFTILALAFVGSPVSGGLFNPAISLGSALLALILHAPHLSWELVGMYVGGALLGGALAAYAFKYLILDEDLLA